jgi:hypothetical protein
MYWRKMRSGWAVANLRQEGLHNTHRSEPSVTARPLTSHLRVPFEAFACASFVSRYANPILVIKRPTLALASSGAPA